MAARPPVAGIVCDRRVVKGHPFHMAGEKYIAALRDGAGLLPLLIPALSPPLAIPDILAVVDGFLFTGSPSNVAPRHYGGAEPPSSMLLDEERDLTALPLILAAIEAGVPTLCICRGFQELNVALGGTLHPLLHEAGFSDHRARDDLGIDEQYGPVHDVRLVPGGLLSELLPDLEPETRFRVNSLHSQGIDRLAPALRIEAEAPDGAIEAVSMDAAKAFVLGVQWHPEWRHAENPVSRRIFEAFGNAVRARVRA
jgi:putative glutamine amidotransferase